MCVCVYVCVWTVCILCVQVVLEQTLHQCRIHGKGSLKSYWDDLVCESRRLSEVAKDQLSKLQDSKVRSQSNFETSVVFLQTCVGRSKREEVCQYTYNSHTHNLLTGV